MLSPKNSGFFCACTKIWLIKNSVIEVTALLSLFQAVAKPKRTTFKKKLTAQVKKIQK
jgi:hypothetical protein